MGTPSSAESRPMVDQLYMLKAALLVKPARSACSPRSHWSHPSTCRERLGQGKG